MSSSVSGDQPAADPAGFEIVDDWTDSTAAIEWAAGELVGGALPETVAATLGEQGWESEQAEQIISQAMAGTRAERGVPDYANAVQRAREYYRNGNRSWMIGFPVWSALRRLLFGLASLRALRRKR